MFAFAFMVHKLMVLRLDLKYIEGNIGKSKRELFVARNVPIDIFYSHKLNLKLSIILIRASIITSHQLLHFLFISFDS